MEVTNVKWPTSEWDSGKAGHPKKGITLREAKGETRRLEVDCGDFTFAVSLGQKRQRKELRWEGSENTNAWKSRRALLRPNKKQNGSVNKKRSLMLVLDTRPQASKALEAEPAFFSGPPSFVEPCVTLRTFPSRNVLPQWRQSGECWAFHLGRPLTGRAERAWNEPRFAQAPLPRATSAFIFPLFWCSFLHWPRSPITISRKRAHVSQLQCKHTHVLHVMFYC